VQVTLKMVDFQPLYTVSPNKWTTNWWQ